MTDAPPAPPEPLLRIEQLRVSFPRLGGRAVAVDGVGLVVHHGESVAIVGESGSGKSVTALSILRLIEPPGRIEGGHVWFGGRDLLQEPSAALRQLRGQEIGMIFQEPMTSLNPLFTVGNQIAEGLRLHERMSARAARARAIELLATVGIPAPRERVDAYPHALSGGMRQRVMIAMALACRPRLLIADEPTTALDVTVQAQILALLRRLREEFRMAMILITHDMGVVARIAERVNVMYAGTIVEEASTRALFAHPAHPYTTGLLECIPRLDEERAALNTMAGGVPSPDDLPPGCRFEPRCKMARPICATLPPPTVEVSPGQSAACLAHTGYRVPAGGAG